MISDGLGRKHMRADCCPRCGYRFDRDRIERRLSTAMQLLTELDLTDALRPSQLETVRELQRDIYERYVRATRRRGA
jgi:hypothetical protein